MKYSVRKHGAIWLSMMLAISSLTGCTSPMDIIGKGKEEETVEEEARLEVSVQAPRIKSISISSNFSGTVVAENEINVVPLIPGEVIEKYFEVGDHVNEGDLLCKIDDEAIQIAVNQAEAAVTQAKAGLNAQTAAAEATKAQANYTRASATQTVGEIPYNQKAMDNAVDGAYAQKRIDNNSLKSAEKQVDYIEDSIDDLEDARDAAKRYRDQYKAKIDAGGAATPEEKAAWQEGYETALSTIAELDSKIDLAKTQKKQAEYSADSAEMNVYTSMEGYDLAQMKRDNYNTYTVPTTMYGAYAQAVGANASDVGADASVTSSAATVKQAQAGLDSAKLNLEHTSVTAPVSGTITAINVSLHNMATQTTPAYTIQTDEPNKIVFYVAEETVRNIMQGDAAVVQKNGKEYPAKITTIYDTIDAEKGLYKVEAVAQGSSAELATGSVVTISTVTRRAENALSVPLDAVYYDGDQPYVYVAKDGAARRLDVSVGISDNESTEITDGLTPADRVITTWSGSMRDGTLIDAKDADPAPQPTPDTGDHRGATTDMVVISAGVGGEE